MQKNSTVKPKEYVTISLEFQFGMHWLLALFIRPNNQVLIHGYFQ